MFCFCSIKSWTFSLNKCSAGFSQPWASPAGGGKGPSKQVWSLCSWSPKWDKSPKAAQLKHRAKCAPVKGAAPPALLGRLCTKQLWDFCAVLVARTMPPCWALQVDGAEGGDPQALPGLLFDTLLLLQSNLHPPALFLLCSQGSRWGLSQTAGTADVPNPGRRCSCLMSPAVIPAKWLKDFLKKASYL